MPLTFTRINASSEVMVKVWMQLTDLKDAIQLPDDRKQALFSWAMDLTRKLESAKYHRDNLLRSVSESFDRLPERAHAVSATFIEINTSVEKEFEAFLLQGKSALDVLVKLFEPLFGIKLHSYGDGGASVSKALKRNLSAQQLIRAQTLISLIEVDKDWIKLWFSRHRDTVAHYRPIASTGFVIPPVTDGTPRQAPPATSDGVALHDAVVVLFHNLLSFAEDFLALSLNVTLPAQFTVGVLAPEARDKDYPRKYGLFHATPQARPGAT